MRVPPRLAREAEPRLSQFKPQELSNVCWAYAKLNLVDRSQLLFMQLARVTCLKLDQYNSQDVSNTLWAYASGPQKGASFTGPSSLRGACASRDAASTSRDTLGRETLTPP